MKRRIWASVAAALLCLTLLTTSLTCGMYARYTTGGTGTEHARVAQFGQLSLTMEQSQGGVLLPDMNTLALNPLVTMTASEVAVKVCVEVTLPKDSGWQYNEDQKNFTCGPVLWTVEDGWTYFPDSNDKNDKTYIFYQTLAPGASLTGVSIVKDGKMSTPANYDDYYNLTDADVNLKIGFKARAIQID